MRSAIRSFTRSDVRIHSTAVVDPTVELGVGVEIGPHAVIQSGARIGDRTRILASVFVASPCVIGPECDIHMGAILGDTAQIRGLQGAGGALEIGARNVIREHVTIHRAMRRGDKTVVGSDNFLLAGSHVAHDCRIGDGTTIAVG